MEKTTRDDFPILSGSFETFEMDLSGRELVFQSVPHHGCLKPQSTHLKDSSFQL